LIAKCCIERYDVVLKLFKNLSLKAKQSFVTMTYEQTKNT